ncbi:hypothetical protein OJAV_G00221400 [Oryzias javanicus]|uniref:Uncharacterized protein n=1 Tax=Oryzias javanicus TaxID=123683 RepID=A0A3S2TVR6_ORYJA|nr:hypothetical protein OJAV_G00221400 [Oryzias javanicus]
MHQSLPGTDSSWAVNERDGQRWSDSGPHPHSWAYFHQYYQRSAIYGAQEPYCVAYSGAEAPVRRQRMNQWTVGNF